MRNRHQKGSLKKQGKSWIAQWWEDGHRRSKTLGQMDEMSRPEALRCLGKIVAPLNSLEGLGNPNRFGEYLDRAFFPWAREKWKGSTAKTTEERIRHHLAKQFRGTSLQDFTRRQLQEFLTDKAASGLAYSTVSHLRWDLRQIFALAVADGFLDKNPAVLLFTPKAASLAPKKRMTLQEVLLADSVLEPRERLICRLAVVAGMRPGEIVSLQWKHDGGDHLQVRQRVYRGEIDSPKSWKSIRDVALSHGLRQLLDQWKRRSVEASPESWIFPSETGSPLSRDNCLRRSIKPRLCKVGLGWVNFQVMRRTHGSLMRELDIDPKLVADQMGNTLDVNLNVYTQSALSGRTGALNRLESALESLMEQVQ